MELKKKKKLTGIDKLSFAHYGGKKARMKRWYHYRNV